MSDSQLVTLTFQQVLTNSGNKGFNESPCFPLSIIQKDLEHCEEDDSLLSDIVSRHALV